MKRVNCRYNDPDGLQTRKHRRNGKAACDKTVNDCNNRKGDMDVVEFQKNILKTAPRCLNVIFVDEVKDRDCLNDAVVSDKHR